MRSVLVALTSVGIFLYMICQRANDYLSVVPKLANLSQMPANPGNRASAHKNGPETGAIDDRDRDGAARSACRLPASKPRSLWRQRPKQGRSPLRTAMRLLAVSEAVDRGHQAAEQRAGGTARPSGCSLGHGCPLSEVAEQFRFVIEDNLCIPDARNNRLVCMAAIGSAALPALIGRLAFAQSKKAAGRPAAFDHRVTDKARLIRPPACAAGRARRNRGSRRPGDR